jgi:hypothetical protein
MSSHSRDESCISFNIFLYVPITYTRYTKINVTEIIINRHGCKQKLIRLLAILVTTVQANLIYIHVKNSIFFFILSCFCHNLKMNLNRTFSRKIFIQSLRAS